MSESREEKLDRLLDERDLQKLAHDFCVGVDRCNVGLVDSVFHEDALDEHGINRTKTARELIDALPTNVAPMAELQHHITTQSFEIDGDRAEGVNYAIAYHRMATDESEDSVLLVMGVRYLDKYERRDGVWKIAHRRLVEDWSIKVPALVARGDTLVSTLPQGGFGEADPAYEFFSSSLRGESRA